MIKKELFANLSDGTPVYGYTLSNDSIVSVRILDYGATIANVWVKDKAGKSADVICGYDTMEGYETAAGYHGATVGRVCNRISNAGFSLNGVEYKLFPNDGKNTLHGGETGFNKRFWSVTEIDGSDDVILQLRYVSPDMEENFPGNLGVTVTYTLTSAGALKINYYATTDKETVVNMTNHSYFNLGGYDSGTICGQLMWLDSDYINDIDNELIPTGKIVPVKGSVYDFNTEKPLGQGFDSDPALARQNGGFDNNFIINDYNYSKVKKIATLKDPVSGRMMTVSTNQPCIQIYTTNTVDDDAIPFKNGVKQLRFGAVAFETQKMPDSINKPGFTNIILMPGEVYDYTTIYSFTNL